MQLVCFETRLKESGVENLPACSQSPNLHPIQLETRFYCLSVVRAEGQGEHIMASECGLYVRNHGLANEIYWYVCYIDIVWMVNGHHLAHEFSDIMTM